MNDGDQDLENVDEEDEIIFENGKKAEELSTYPNKLGELYGGMHLHMSRLVIRRLMKGLTIISIKD